MEYENQDDLGFSRTPDDFWKDQVARGREGWYAYYPHMQTEKSEVYYESYLETLRKFAFSDGTVTQPKPNVDELFLTPEDQKLLAGMLIKP